MRSDDAIGQFEARIERIRVSVGTDAMPEFRAACKGRAADNELGNSRDRLLAGTVIAEMIAECAHLGGRDGAFDMRQLGCDGSRDRHEVCAEVRNRLREVLRGDIGPKIDRSPTS